MPHARHDLTGQTFQIWKVLSWHSRRPKGTDSGDYHNYWNVECVTCGKQDVLSTGGLKHHLSATSKRWSECWHWKDELLNRRFGRLLVTAKLDRDQYGNQQWTCLCDCGTILVAKTASLVSQNTKSCGCLRFDAYARRRGCKYPQLSLGHGVSSFNVLVKEYKRGAWERGHTWELSDNQARILFERDCFYCGVKPSRFFKGRTSDGAFICNGIDRKNNKLSYTPENCVSCCKQCNIAKRALSAEEFLAWVARVYKHSVARKRKQPVAIDLSRWEIEPLVSEAVN